MVSRLAFTHCIEICPDHAGPLRTCPMCMCGFQSLRWVLALKKEREIWQGTNIHNFYSHSSLHRGNEEIVVESKQRDKNADELSQKRLQYFYSNKEKGEAREGKNNFQDKDKNSNIENENLCQPLLFSSAASATKSVPRSIPISILSASSSMKQREQDNDNYNKEKKNCVEETSHNEEEEEEKEKEPSSDKINNVDNIHASHRLLSMLQKEEDIEKEEEDIEDEIPPLISGNDMPEEDFISSAFFPSSYYGNTDSSNTINQQMHLEEIHEELTRIENKRYYDDNNKNNNFYSAVTSSMCTTPSRSSSVSPSSLYIPPQITSPLPYYSSFSPCNKNESETGNGKKEEEGEGSNNKREENASDDDKDLFLAAEEEDKEEGGKDRYATKDNNSKKTGTNTMSINSNQQQQQHRKRWQKVSVSPPCCARNHIHCTCCPPSTAINNRISQIPIYGRNTGSSSFFEVLPADVQQIMEMGFPKEIAEQALAQCHANLHQALNLLLNQAEGLGG